MTAEGNATGIYPEWQVYKSPTCSVVEELATNHFNVSTVVHINSSFSEVPKGQEEETLGVSAPVVPLTKAGYNRELEIQSYSTRKLLFDQ